MPDDPRDWDRAMADERVPLATPPHNLDVEQQVLGALMIDGTAIDRVEPLLAETDFYAHAHQIAYAALRRLLIAGKPGDAVSLAETLDAEGKLDKAGGLVGLMAMQANVPTASMAEHWARRVRSYARRRRLAALASDLGAAAFAKDGRDADELIDEAQRALAKIAEEGAASDGDRSLGEILPALMETLERRMAHGGELPGLPTGIGDLDERILGLKGGELVIVAGRPSMGKTTLAVQFAREAAKEGKTALIFSLEMRPTALAEALLSSIGHIDAWKLRSGKLTHEDWSEISATYARASGMPIRIDGSPRLTLERMRARARQVKRKHGLSIIVLDYIQLMEGDAGEERNQQVAAISRGLKLIANELDVPVVALSQLNRSCEARTNKRPMMSDLRDSGAVEADADVILFVYRDEVYNHDDAELKGKAEIIVGKQREGEGGTVYAAFVGHHKRFADTDWRPQRRESKRRAAPDDL